MTPPLPANETMTSRTLSTRAALAFASFCNIALGPINGTIAKFSAQYAARGEYGKVRSIYREAARRMALYGFVVFALAALAEIGW